MLLPTDNLLNARAVRYCDCSGAMMWLMLHARARWSYNFATPYTSLHTRTSPHTACFVVSGGRYPALPPLVSNFFDTLVVGDCAFHILLPSNNSLPFSPTYR